MEMLSFELYRDAELGWRLKDKNGQWLTKYVSQKQTITKMMMLFWAMWRENPTDHIKVTFKWTGKEEEL